MRQSQYLAKLEHLKDELTELKGLSAIGVRMKRIQRYFDAAEVALVFSKLKKNIEDKVPDMDNCGIDYKYWAGVFGNYALPPTPPANSYDESLIKSRVNRMQDHLTDNDRSGLTPEKREKMGSALSYITSLHEVSDYILDSAFCNAIKELSKTLTEIADLDETEHYPESSALKELYTTYARSSNSKQLLISLLNSQYESWKRQHVTTLSKDVLVTQRWKYLKQLFDSGFLCNSYTELPITRDSRSYQVYCSELTLSDGTVLLTDSYLQQYHYWRQFFNHEDDVYTLKDPTGLGKHLYTNRIELDDELIEKYFDCLHFLDFVQEDLYSIGRGQAELLQAKINFEFDFDNLVCELPEDKLALFNIKTDSQVYWALVERRMAEQKKPKINWAAVYCVLLHFDLIDNNVAAFCSAVKSAYDINLDKSNVSNFLKDQEEDYTKWPQEGPHKKKREIAVNLDKDFSAFKKYLQIKKQIRLKSLLTD